MYDKKSLQDITWSHTVCIITSIPLFGSVQVSCTSCINNPKT